MHIYPAILTDSLDTFEEQLAVIKNQPEAKVLHVDVIDGFFVDNLTLTPVDLVGLDLGSLQLDFHLMTEEPLGFAEEVINYGGYWHVRSVIGQVEKMTSQEDFVDLLLGRGIDPGLALNLYTPDEEISDQVLSKLKVLQLMAIEAGEQGKKFNTLVLEKLEAIIARAKIINPTLRITLDGGIKLEHLDLLKKYQIDGVVVGSGIWQSPNPATTLESFLHE